MKRIRRKKSSTSIHTHQEPVPAVPTPPYSLDTPLHARFTSSHKPPNGTSLAKPTVSGPMALAAKPITHNIPTRGTSFERDQLKRVPSRPDQEKVLSSPSHVPSRKIPPARNAAIPNGTQHRVDRDLPSAQAPFNMYPASSFAQGYKSTPPISPTPLTRAASPERPAKVNAREDMAQRGPLPEISMSPMRFSIALEGGKIGDVTPRSAAKRLSVSVVSMQEAPLPNPIELPDASRSSIGAGPSRFDSLPSPTVRPELPNHSAVTTPMPHKRISRVIESRRIESGQVLAPSHSQSPTVPTKRLSLEGTPVQQPHTIVTPLVGNQHPPRTSSLLLGTSSTSTTSSSAEARGEVATAAQLPKDPLRLQHTTPTAQSRSPPRSLLSASPSTARKKYSPLAAFGFPPPQAKPSTPPPVVTPEPIPVDQVQSQHDVDRGLSGPAPTGSETIPDIPSPQPSPSPLEHSLPPPPEPTLPEHRVASNGPNAHLPGTGDTSPAVQEPRSQGSPPSLKPPPERASLSPDPTTGPPEMATTLVHTISELHVRAALPPASKSSHKRSSPPSNVHTQAEHGTTNGYDHRSRKLTKPHHKRDSPPLISSGTHSPTGQPWGAGDPTSSVTMSMLDNSLPSDSRYPLPSRSHSRSSPHAPRKSPDVTPDLVRSNTTTKEAAPPAGVMPKSSRSQHRRSESLPQHPSMPLNPPPPPSLLPPFLATYLPSPPPPPMGPQVTTPLYQNGPVRGKPLIFAAMPAPSSEVGDIEPDPEVGDGGMDTKTPSDDVSFAPHSDPSSVTSGSGSLHKQGAPEKRPPESDREPRRPRKLSKPRKPTRSSSRDAAPQPKPEAHPSQSAHQPSSYSEQPAASSHQAPQPSPVHHLQPPSRSAHDGHPSGDGSAHRRTQSVDGKYSRHGVKALTEKQLEKLHKSKALYQSHPQIDMDPQANRDQPSKSSHSPPNYSVPTKHPLPTPPSPDAHSQTHANSHYRTDSSSSTRSASEKHPEARKSRHCSDSPRPDGPEAQTPEFDRASSRRSSESIIEREPTPEPRFYPLVYHVSDPVLFGNLLPYLVYFDWCQLMLVSKEIKGVVSENRRLEELVLERFLTTVGYERWSWKQPEPLQLNLQDLADYMRGVSIPSHQYSRTAEAYLQLNTSVNPVTIQELAASCRSFTRVVLRLRAQAEAEADHNARLAYSRSHSSPSPSESAPSPTKLTRVPTQGAHPSRPPSSSSFAHSHSHAHSIPPSQPLAPVNTFRSPLFRPRRAPLLQVFVPSPEGDWLSDTSVLECEAELKRAGVIRCLRAGDVVWDVAVGDEGNVGRMVWDGSYLIDLDYAYSRGGDLPRYLPTLAFPPSYFHRVIRTMGSGNPIVHVDISPWADQIAANLRLLQDRMKAETPQGGHHTVMGWIHRTTFVIKPASGTRTIRLPVPSTAGPGPSSTGAWVVDPGWYGTVVLETEGTNEGLDDLQVRCRRVFAQRAGGAAVNPNPGNGFGDEQRTVFRIVREKSRPGEIWLRTVHVKERLIR